MTDDTTDQGAIGRLEAERCRALLDADVAALERLTDADYQHVETGGTTRDRAGFLAAIARPDHRFVLWVIEESRVVVHGDVAIVTGRYRNQLRTPAGLQAVKQARFVRVWVRRDDAWRNVVHQATALAC